MAARIVGGAKQLFVIVLYFLRHGDDYLWNCLAAFRANLCICMFHHMEYGRVEHRVCVVPVPVPVAGAGVYLHIASPYHAVHSDACIEKVGTLVAVVLTWVQNLYLCTVCRCQTS